MSAVRDIAQKREITIRLKREIKEEALWERAEKFCLHLAKMIHAPVSPAEYRRMEKYLDDEDLTDAVYRAVKDYFYTDNNADGRFDVIGHTYCVALLSQSKRNRAEILDYFDRFADVLIKDNEQGYGKAMYRNMKQFSKKYPDLKELEKKLEHFRNYGYWAK